MTKRDILNIRIKSAATTALNIVNNLPLADNKLESCLRFRSLVNSPARNKLNTDATSLLLDIDNCTDVFTAIVTDVTFGKILRTVKSELSDITQSSNMSASRLLNELNDFITGAQPFFDQIENYAPNSSFAMYLEELKFLCTIVASFPEI